MAEQKLDKAATTGVWAFYVVFVVIFLTEATIVHFLGLWYSLIGFTVGGSILGVLELHSIKTEQKLRDPILRFGCWLLERFGWFGYILNAALLGPMAAAIALKKLDFPMKFSFTLYGALIFAVIWVPLFHFVWA